MTKRGKAFSLMEMLVVISLIVLLIGLILPSLSSARRNAQQVKCGSRMHQLMVAIDAFANDNDQNFPPMQRLVNGVEYSWRGILYSYTQRTPEVFDCPSETTQQYANGAFDDRGNPTANETYIWSGIGAVNVHYNRGARFRPAFGRWDRDYPAYGNGRAPVANYVKIQNPGQMIVFGDGNSSYDSTGKLYYFKEDAFWIYKDAALDSPGFNRAAVPAMGGNPEEGLERHGGEFDANYAFADQSVKLLDANKIPCSTTQCWWDAQVDPH